MRRPPKKAIEQIKNYCEKTQCRRCYFGVEYKGENYVGCALQETNPCEWEVWEEEENGM